MASTSTNPPLPDEPAPALAPATEDGAKAAESEVDGDENGGDGEEVGGNGGGEGEETQGVRDEKENVKEGEETDGEKKAAPVHKGANDWQAIWSQEANAYYFWNSRTQETTWTNPLTPSSSLPSTSAPSSSLTPDPSYGGIDPDLAYLDPSLSRSSTAQGGSGSFAARFNARTGRFQGDPSMNPDRISEFSRGKRQQEAFYDVEGWEKSLDGKSLKRERLGMGTEEEGEKKKRVTAKDVERFKEKKLDKKKKKLAAWLKD